MEITALQYYLLASIIKINYYFQCIKLPSFQQKTVGNNPVLSQFNRKLVKSFFFYPNLQDLKDPSWRQWREFTVKYLFLPYQLIAEFAWDWLDVHYWTSRFIIVNAMLLSVLELFSFWRLWSRRELK